MKASWSMYGGKKQRSQRSQSRKKMESGYQEVFFFFTFSFLLLMFANHVLMLAAMFPSSLWDVGDAGHVT